MDYATGESAPTTGPEAEPKGDPDCGQRPGEDCVQSSGEDCVQSSGEDCGHESGHESGQECAHRCAEECAEECASEPKPWEEREPPVVQGSDEAPPPELERWLRGRFPGLRDAAAGLDLKTTSVMLVAALLLIVFRKFGTSAYFEANLAWSAIQGGGLLSIYGDGYWFLACFVVLGVIPLVLSLPRGLRPERLGLGIGLGDWRFGLRWTGLLFLPMFAVVFVASRFDAFSSYYPLNDVLSQDAVRYFAGQPTRTSGFIGLFLVYELLYAVYFIGWEYFFRGYLTFNLFDRLGAHGVLVGNIPFALMHVGKPFPEALGSIVAGVALGLFALRARSFWYGFILHVAIAWSMDFWAIEARVT